MMNRRQMLLAAAPAATLPFLPFTPKLARAVVPAVGIGGGGGGAAVYSAAQSSFSIVGAKTKLGTLVQSDLRTAISALSGVASYFNQTGANSEFQALATYAINGTFGSLPTSNMNLPIASQTYSAVIGVSPSLTNTSVHSDLTNALQILIPPAQQLSLFQTLQENGILEPLNSTIATLTGNLTRLPTVAPAHPQILVGPPAGEAFCTWFNWLTGALGASVWSLLFGCTETPFFEVICPAVVAMSIIVGAIALLDWLLC